MVQTLQVPNTRTFKMIGEQSTGAETAVLVDSSGHLQVDVISGASTVGAVADDAAAGTGSSIMVVGGRYDTAPDDVDDGDAVTLQADIKGRLITVDKNEATDDAAAPAAGIMVCGKFASMSPDANDATFLRVGSTGQAVVEDINVATDDAAAPTKGAMVLGRYQAAEDTVDDGDAAPLRVNSAGRLIVVDGNTATDDAAAPTVGPLIMGKFGASTPDANDAAPLQCDSAGILLTTESSAAAVKTAVEIMDDWDEVHDSACGTDGALVMAHAKGTGPTAVDADDAVKVWADRQGRVQVTGHHAFSQGSGDHQVAAAACIVHRIIITTTAAGTLTIYNNTVEAAPAAVVLTFGAATYATVIDMGGTYFGTGCYVGKDGAWAGEVTVVYDLA